MPTNCKMPELKRAFELTGFTEVKTVLGSGNVVFSHRTTAESTLERQIEEAIATHLGRRFSTFVRRLDDLSALIEADPFAAFSVTPGAKRNVSFLRALPAVLPTLPIEGDGFQLLALRGHELLTTHIPRHPDGPVFMRKIEEMCGKDVTTCTWETIRKIEKAGNHP
jgi:uncharacterized protein (DUF1697 family)